VKKLNCTSILTRIIFVTMFMYGIVGGAALSQDQLPRVSASPAATSLLTPDFSVAAGGEHTCALTKDGGVKCWGNNAYGQLGNNTNINSSTPVAVSGLTSDVARVTAGDHHSCALTSSGAAFCWGLNYSGQLGDGTTDDRLTPVAVIGLDHDVTDVQAGGYHTCALVNGGVQCWGDNWAGQLGNGTTDASNTPVPVTSLGSGVSAISLGYGHACALAGGVVKCWGDNYNDQLGLDPIDYSATPLDVAGLPAGIIAIATGGAHTCALTGEGAVKCWGKNEEGQLGNDTNVSSYSPVDVSGLSSGVVAISAGYNFSCAITSSGGVKCWGGNGSGQLGDDTLTSRSVPVNATGLTSGVEFITAGGAHTCTRLSSGEVKCWGNNINGQIGNGVVIPHIRTIPQDVVGSGVTGVSGGSRHTCAVVNGAALCWGDNDLGQLGDTTTLPRSIPMGVSGLGSNVIAITAGEEHSCAITVGGAPFCWGNNNNGQLGNNSEDYNLHPIPEAVYNLTSGVTAISGGNIHTCAIVSDGAQCWGRGWSGQLGDGSSTDIPHPVQVFGMPAASGVTAITAGGYHTCAVVNGAAKCWGSNYFGELGDNTTTSNGFPVDVIGLGSGVTAISAGPWHTCAVVNGAAKCWGGNDYGKLGDNSTTDSLIPVQVSGLESGVVAIAAGNDHTCALMSTGAVKCWGLNWNGQLGNGEVGISKIPVDVSGLSSGVSAISAGSNFTCAIVASGGLKCWGDAYDGQLGIGTFGFELTPVLVTGLDNYKFYFPLVVNSGQ